jgi:hypothetical protein
LSVFISSNLIFLMFLHFLWLSSFAFLPILSFHLLLYSLSLLFRSFSCSFSPVMKLS